MEYTMNHRVQGRRGNHHSFMAPHGCYPCKGDDRWATIAIGSDKEWESFCGVIGNPRWTEDEKFSDGLNRWKNRDELDRLIGDWTSTLDHYEVMRILQEAGVTAGPVLDAKELLEDPHLNDRGFYEQMTRKEVGTHPYPGSPIRLSKTPTHIRMPAPNLGEHNEYVLSKIVGLTTEEIRELEKEQVIGDRPLDM